MKNLLRIEGKEHFFVQALKRGFDMASIVSLHEYVSKNAKNIQKNKKLEHNIGYATVVYSIDNNNTIHLITGWMGNRKKEKFQ